jgi:hypothetical protein
MIELNASIGGQSRIMVVLVNSIARFTPSGTRHTALTLTDSTELTAVVPYERFREAVSTARSQFVSLLEAAA